MLVLCQKTSLRDAGAVRRVLTAVVVVDGLDCLISGIDCPTYGHDSLISGIDCLMFGLDRRISGFDCPIRTESASLPNSGAGAVRRVPTAALRGARAHVDCLISGIDCLVFGIDCLISGLQVRTLSGGYRRRLSVALALVGQPRLVVLNSLNSVTSGIDCLVISFDCLISGINSPISTILCLVLTVLYLVLTVLCVSNAGAGAVRRVLTAALRGAGARVDWLISGIDCLMFCLDCLISGIDCLSFGLDRLISGLDCPMCVECRCGRCRAGTAGGSPWHWRLWVSQDSWCSTSLRLGWTPMRAGCALHP